ncbi:TetR/AcrR family transcriptional regulator [Oenococcus sicerae]|uniref:TetR/AcrR family transcriptional regulator n=1 Tax=Oenococcus sicerae TaxID=2203724 RepID=A0AAE5TQD2_9LACO|nr:TetR family transcriptional regulator [Oenococcus sicerae]QAS69388.1 TetR/AcrR family transcriptional regulator [Oenococcus sicerae]
MSETRRRGVELTNAIYRATEKIIDLEGMEGLTFQKVADAAMTSKSVIYRRWESPLELAIAAVQDRIRRDNNGSMDDLILTGNSLKEDLLQVTDRFLISINIMGKTFIRGMFVESGRQSGQILQRLIDQNSAIDLRLIDRVLQRAIDRGEHLRPNISHELKLLPFEWLRYNVFLQREIDQEMCQILINDILLPVYLDK